MRRYLIVSRNRKRPPDKHWDVWTSDIQLKASAVNQAREYALKHPEKQVQVWVEITTINVVIRGKAWLRKRKHSKRRRAPAPTSTSGSKKATG